MNIEIVCVGKLKEKYLKQGIDEYLKRLQAYAQVKIIEVADEPTNEDLSDNELQVVLSKEAERIMSKIGDGRQLIALTIEGKLVSSEDIAETLDKMAIHGQSKVTFLIGGSLGLHEQLKQKAHGQMSFGRITLPHQLMRLVLVEQIYRAFRIMKGHAYHK